MFLFLAEELKNRDWDVVPVLPAPGRGILSEDLRKRGFEAEHFTLRGPYDPACWWNLVKVLRRRRVSIAHSHEFSMALYGTAAARWAGLPHVLTMHGVARWADRLRRRVALRWACRSSAFTVGVSRAVTAALSGRLRLVQDTVRVVPNGVNPLPGDRKPVRSELGLPPETILVLCLGNLYPVKGYDVLLRALSGLRSIPVEWHLAIAGRGGEESALRELAAAEGLSGRVSFLGWRNDVGNLLAAADLFALPSRSEGHPLALLDAMHAGLPIVASAVGGIPDTARDGVEALLVPREDHAALAGALHRFFMDPELRARMGHAAARQAAEQFTVRAMADRYEHLYARALSGRARGNGGEPSRG